MHSRHPILALILNLALIPALSVSTASAAKVQDPAPAPAPAPTSITAPAQVEVWPLEKTAALGSTLYLHNRAATRATDALIAHLGGTAPQGLLGWIIIPQNDSILVRYLFGDILAPTAGYEILVDAQGHPGAVVQSTETALPPVQVAQFHARMSAGTSFSPSDPPCARQYNAVELYDAETGGWLVWLLASNPQPDIIALEGHYRFHISPNGQTIQKREALSNGCLEMEKTPQTANLMTTVSVAPTPLEVHVFTSLNTGLPIYIAAGDRSWLVDGTRIENAGPTPQRR